MACHQFIPGMQSIPKLADMYDTMWNRRQGPEGEKDSALNDTIVTTHLTTTSSRDSTARLTLSRSSCQAQPVAAPVSAASSAAAARVAAGAAPGMRARARGTLSSSAAVPGCCSHAMAERARHCCSRTLSACTATGLMSAGTYSTRRCGMQF
jgi:hypothetical protein